MRRIHAAAKTLNGMILQNQALSTSSATKSVAFSTSIPFRSPLLPSKSCAFITVSRPSLYASFPKRFYCSPSTLQATASAAGNGVASTAVATTSQFEQTQTNEELNQLLEQTPVTIVDQKDKQKQPEKPLTKEQREHQSRAVENFRLSPEIISKLKQNSITHFTEVQAGTFDLLYEGKDIIAKSRTGTGKTLAFVLPIIEKLSKEQYTLQRGKPKCVILTPTRELAKQVSRETANYCRALKLRVECFYGGTSYLSQEQALKNGFDILVGTPGRIIDHINKGTLLMTDIRFAVLDEADEMLSMGFSQDVELIFKGLPPADSRQVILFSATVPSWVKKLASEFQSKNVHTFDAINTGTMTATTVQHCAVRVPENDEARANLLADIIAVHSISKVKKLQELHLQSSDTRNENVNFSPSRVIVFTQTKKEADELATSGALDGCGAAVLHGDVTQKQRELTLSQFRKGLLQVLVATDVAARGLDISGVDVVVQYRVPMETEAYVHRAGRTGRAGKSGTAVVLYSDREMSKLQHLERDCKIKFDYEIAPAPELALEAAVDVAIANLPAVDGRVIKHLRQKALNILNDKNTDEHIKVDIISGLLAMAGRRTSLQDRSILSGESGMRTLLVKCLDNNELLVGKALRFINDISDRSDNNEKLRVGLIRLCQNGNAVVDVSSEQAELLLDAWKAVKKSKEGNEMKFDHFDLELELATALPVLKESRMSNNNAGRGRDRRRSSGGWQDRGRNSGGQNGRSNWRNRGARNEGGYGGGGYGGGGYGGGGGRYDGGYGSGSGRRDNYQSRDGNRGNQGGRRRYSDGDNYNRGGGGGGKGRRYDTQFLDNDF